MNPRPFKHNVLLLTTMMGWYTISRNEVASCFTTTTQTDLYQRRLSISTSSTINKIPLSSKNEKYEEKTKSDGTTYDSSLETETSLHQTTNTPKHVDGFFTELENHQKRAQEIAYSFVSQSYSTPYMFTNPHFQTIAGAFLRNSPLCKYWNIDSFNVRQSQWQGWDRRERITTPDGDFFHVDYKKRTTSDYQGFIVVTHGFESNSNSPLIFDTAKAYISSGYDVACINFRGCSGEPNLTMGGYHLGFTDDLKQYLSILRDRGVVRQGPVYLSGFSLGSNVILKLLGELGESAINEYNIQGCAVTGVPLDASRNSIKFHNSLFNSLVYTPNFLKTIQPKAQLQYERNKGNVPFNLERVMASKTVADIETHYVSPIYGFRDNIDYYEQVSCGQFLKGIAVPTLIINAKDDPFLDADIIPEQMSPNPVRYISTDKGGHLGFMFHEGKSDKLTDVSWVSNEFRRFVDHVNKMKRMGSE